MGNICSTDPQVAKPKTCTQSTQTSAFPDICLENEVVFNEKVVQKLNLSLCLAHMQKFRLHVLNRHFFTWKDLIIASLSESSSMLPANCFEADLIDSAQLTENNLAEARDLILFENKVVIRESPLFQHMEQVKKSEEVPMALTSLFRYFEEMMDKKYEADLSNISAGRDFVTIPDFFLDHLVRVYGLKKLAQKSMIQMMITLKQLNDQNHGYGKLLCQLLHIFDFNPIPNHLAFFLTKARYETNKIINNKKSLKSKRLEEIHIAEAFSLIYSLLPTSRFARAKALNSIKPKTMTDSEFLLFKVSMKTIRLGMTPEQMFDSIDSKSRGKISVKSLAKFMQRSLEILVEDQDVASMSSIFDTKRASKISKPVFLSKLLIKTSAEYLKQETLTIPKSLFLSNFVEVFKIVQLRETAFLTNVFKSFKKLHLNLQEFLEALKKVNQNFVVNSPQQLFEESLFLNSDCSLVGVSLDSFIKTIENQSVLLNDFNSGLLETSKLPESPEKDRKLKKQASDLMIERKDRPRRSSNILEKTGLGFSRGSTPVDNSNNLRSKSPVFGSKP